MMGADFFIPDEGNPEKRLGVRLEQSFFSNGCRKIYLRQKHEFDPLVKSGQNHAIIDSSKPFAVNIRQVMDRINEE